MKVNKILKSRFKNLLNSKYVLYGVLFIALTNVVGYMSLQNYEAVMLFALVGFLTQYFSSNMIIILSVPIVFTALFATARHNVREGLDNKTTHKKHEKNKPIITSTADNSQKSSTPTCLSGNTFKKCGTLKGCLWDTKSETCKAEPMTNLHPKWIKDDEKTEEDFYKNLPEDVDNIGIAEMSKRTDDLVKNQKNLRNTMTKMMPMMDQAQNLLSNIDTDSMKEIMDMAQSLTAPFQKTSDPKSE